MYANPDPTAYAETVGIGRADRTSRWIDVYMSYTRHERMFLLGDPLYGKRAGGERWEV